VKTVVVGAGGLGGLFGGLMARAGEDVWLIDRGAHLKAIVDHGLLLKAVGGEAIEVEVKATDDPSEPGPADLIVFCVKTYDLEEAARSALSLVADQTAILPVQNGVRAPDLLAGILGPEHVLGGVSYYQGTVETPGVVSFGRVSGRLYMGELTGGTSRRVERIRGRFAASGIDAEVHADIRSAMWEKLVLVCATGGVMAYFRKPIGPVLANPSGRAMLAGVMEEAEVVARAKGIGLPEGAARHMMSFIEGNMSPSARSSLLTDLLAGRRLELEALNGEIVRLGLELGIPTPHNTRVYNALKPYANGPARYCT
jgi:2-dehydropantoate 2-reductase